MESHMASFHLQIQASCLDTCVPCFFFYIFLTLKHSFLSGSATFAIGPWERVTLIEQSGLTMDVKSQYIYVLTENKIRAVDVKKKAVIFERPVAGIPWPIKCYEFVDEL